MSGTVCASSNGMDIRQINKRYFLDHNMYDAVLNGISSSLIAYRNGILHIEVITCAKWKKEENSTAFEMAHRWKERIPEFRNAIGCKVYITDLQRRSSARNFHHMGIRIPYASGKGILFKKNQLN